MLRKKRKYLASSSTAFRCNLYIYRIPVHYKELSIMKGYRGNAAGDGPIAIRDQSRREFIARNGFFLSKRRRHESVHENQNNSPYFVSDISSPTIQQKFTSQTIPTLNDVILELNYDNIARYNYQYVISSLQRSDIY